MLYCRLEASPMVSYERAQAVLQSSFPAKERPTQRDLTEHEFLVAEPFIFSMPKLDRSLKETSQP